MRCMGLHGCAQPSQPAVSAADPVPGAETGRLWCSLPADLCPLASLPALRQLSLVNVRQTVMEPLLGLTQLQSLSLAACSFDGMAARPLPRRPGSTAQRSVPGSLEHLELCAFDLEVHSPVYPEAILRRLLSPGLCGQVGPLSPVLWTLNPMCHSALHPWKRPSKGARSQELRGLGRRSNVCALTGCAWVQLRALYLAGIRLVLDIPLGALPRLERLVMCSCSVGFPPADSSFLGSFRHPLDSLALEECTLHDLGVPILRCLPRLRCALRRGPGDAPCHHRRMADLATCQAARVWTRACPTKLVGGAYAACCGCDEPVCARAALMTALGACGAGAARLVSSAAAAGQGRGSPQICWPGLQAAQPAGHACGLGQGAAQRPGQRGGGAGGCPRVDARGGARAQPGPQLFQSRWVRQLAVMPRPGSRAFTPGPDPPRWDCCVRALHHPGVSPLRRACHALPAAHGVWHACGCRATCRQPPPVQPRSWELRALLARATLPAACSAVQPARR